MIYAAIALICAILALVYARYIEPGMLTVTHARIELEGIEKPMRIAAIADLHVNFGGMNCGRIRKIRDKILEQDPDVAVFLGDLFEHYAKYSLQRERELADALLLPEIPLKLAVAGNHDANAVSAFREVFARAGWKVLINEKVCFRGLNIVGSDTVKFGKPDIYAKIAQNMPNLVLVHEPDYAETLSGVQLQLSGHTHGGQVRVPVIGPLKLPKYGKKFVHGMHEKPDGGRVFVTRGVGMSTLPLRFLAPPEIAVIQLFPKAAAPEDCHNFPMLANLPKI